RLGPSLRSLHDHVGVVQLTNSFHVPSVPSRKEGPQHRDVLPRHRLLRQAHGFEGLFRLTEGTKAKHLSIAKLEHPARGRFALHAAPLATVVDPTDEQGEVTDAERVVNLGSRSLKGIVEVAHISPRAIVAPVRATAFA